MKHIFHFIDSTYTSVFFISEADQWREDARNMIEARPDVEFVIVTKRVERIMSCLPHDWGEGYRNVTLYSTVENMRRAGICLPVFKDGRCYRIARKDQMRQARKAGIDIL